MSNIYNISNFASPFVMTTSGDTSLKDAMEMMHESKIRHLPITEMGEVVGIISERDLKLFDDKDFADKFNVRDIMIHNPLFVSEDTHLKVVVDKLLETKFGSCLVKGEDGEVTGIFTMIDALRALKEFLNK
jgi:acetoin utilization protein AcuB